MEKIYCLWRWCSCSTYQRSLLCPFEFRCLLLVQTRERNEEQKTGIVSYILELSFTLIHPPANQGWKLKRKEK